MALQGWPSKVDVEFTEVAEQINAIIYDPFSRKVLAAFQNHEPEAIMLRVRETREEHGSEAVFPRPWPPRMKKFIRNAIAEARQKPADSGSNMQGIEKPKPAKGK